MVNDTIRIPAWWHDCISGVGQFDSMNEVRLALIYYSIVKKFVYDFVKNDKRRIIVKCSKKEKTGCAWKLHASPMTHTTRFAIKTFNSVHTCGENMGTNGHKRASRIWGSAILQTILKHRPTYRPCILKKISKSNLE